MPSRDHEHRTHRLAVVAAVLATVAAVLTPTGPATAATGWAEVDAGTSHTCAIRASDSSLWCWGDNSSGQLGLGPDSGSWYTAPQRVGTDTDWTLVGAGHDHTCGIRRGSGTGRVGTLWCWGENGIGQLGIGSATDQQSPVQVGTEETWTGVALGNAFSCGHRVDGTLWCWGDTSGGRLGVVGGIYQMSPVQVALGGMATAVSTGMDFACALRRVPSDRNTLWCWGANLYGQLGIGYAVSQLVPTLVGTGTTWRSVSSGDRHTCGTTSTPTGTELWCWGNNDSGQLGTGYTGNPPWPLPRPYSPVRIGSAWQLVQAGGAHTCAIQASSSSLWCWGDNSRGQLGLGDLTTRDEPVQLSAETAARQVSLGGAHTCRLSFGGSLACWGDNSKGQVGIDSRVRAVVVRPTVVPVPA